MECYTLISHCVTVNYRFMVYEMFWQITITHDDSNVNESIHSFDCSSVSLSEEDA